MSPFEAAVSRREEQSQQQSEQQESEGSPRLEVDVGGTQRLNEALVWTGTEPQSRRKEHVLQKWKSFVFHMYVSGLQFIRGMYAFSFRSEDMPDDVVELAGGAVLLHPLCVSCKEGTATELCRGMLCCVSRCSICAVGNFKACTFGQKPYCPLCACTCQVCSPRATASGVARPDRVYRDNKPAKLVRDHWSRIVRSIFRRFQHEVDCVASNA